MDDYKIYTKPQLNYMNFDKKYGSQWISNINDIKHNQDVKLYATGDYTMGSGRIYIALPADKKLSSVDIEKYNIICNPYKSK